MKVFIAYHKGVWLGGCSVVIAKDRNTALQALKVRLQEQEINTDDYDIDLTELNTSDEAVIIMFNGDY